MTKCTLLFLVKNGKVLLARKKRGVGKDLWNGVGGKLEPGESWEQAVVRECREEILVTPKNFKHMANIDFSFFDDNQPKDMYVQVYTCASWDGVPKETEEMDPQWYQVDDIPFNKMWDDDKYWLEEVLDGRFVQAKFSLDEAGLVISKQIVVDKV